jgi:hypothetical protein
MALLDRFRRLTTRDPIKRDTAAHEPAAAEPRGQPAADPPVRDQSARDQSANNQSAGDQPAHDGVTVGAFIDEQSFRLAQACVQDYARLRAGEGADALFADPSFTRALDKACWEGYPRALVMVGMVVESALRSHAAADLNGLRSGLVATILETFDQRPVPLAIGDVDWRAARADLERSLGDLTQMRPKSAEAIAEDHSTFYLAIMPLHAQLGPDDFPALRDQLKRSLVQIQETFLQWANPPVLASELIARATKIEAGEAPSTSP